LGVHRLDLALWLMGYPKPQYVAGSTYDSIASRIAKEAGKDFNVEDLAAGFIRFENNATLIVEASWAGNIRERELMETRLWGTRGGLIQYNLNEGYDFSMEIFTEHGGAQYDVKLHERTGVPGAQSAMAHFVECIRNNKPHIATGEEGLIVMEILDAIYQSAKSGQPVWIGHSDPVPKKKRAPVLS
jgi:predicted dehydrogenase